jgi:hypothetical protein
MAGGRQERTGGPAGRGGPHPEGPRRGETRRAGTKRRTPAQPGLRHAAAGPQGSGRPPARPVPQAPASARECALSAWRSKAPPSRVMRSSSEWTETPQSDSAPRQRRRARSRRRRETPWDTGSETLPLSRTTFMPTVTDSGLQCPQRPQRGPFLEQNSAQPCPGEHHQRADHAR